MPATTQLEGRTVHYCRVCFLAYEDEDLEGRCERHCRAHPTCSLELGRQAVGSVADSVEKRDDDAAL